VSNEVRLQGVRVGSTLISSSKSKTDVSWLLIERRCPCIGDHWSDDVAWKGDKLSSFFHPYNESESESLLSLLLFTSVEKHTRKKKFDGSKPIWSPSFNSLSISFVNWIVLLLDER
jgi:hypothetical protein